MRTISVLTLWIFGLMGCCPGAVAAAAPTIDQILGFYHTEQALDESLANFEEALERRRTEVTVPDANYQEILNVAARIYRKKNLYEVFRQAYAKVITAEQMAALWQWMNTPLGAKLKTAYDAVYKMSPQQLKQAFDKESRISLKPNRKNALTTLIKSAEQDGLYAVARQGADFGVYMALNAFAPAGGRDQVKYLKEKIRAHKSGYLEPGRQRFMMFNAVLLKEFRDNEIDEMSKFAASADGQAAHRAFARALELTLEGAGQTIFTQLLQKQGT